MRTLIILRGAPGSGKSTFLKNSGLEPYSTCADSIRLLLESPVADDENGRIAISQKNDKKVWEMLFEILEHRMERGELCIVDATHTRPKDFSKYKELMEKYRYRGYCIDFSDVPIETCKLQNKSREQWKFVPETVIDVMYARMAEFKVPTYFTVINRNDTKAIDLIVNRYEPFDANKYEKIAVFGDIHGCYEPLKEYFDSNPFNEDTLYVFTGDYLDRGTKNDEVVQWLLEHYTKDNVILLQGNHERWLIDYANGEYDEEIKTGVRDKCRSAMFFDNTLPQIEGFKKKNLRELCRKLRQVTYLSFDGKKYLISHAGIGFMPDSIVKVKTDTFIKGNGKYEDPIDEWFEKNEGVRNPDLYQIHAHRNTTLMPIHPVEHSFNLCDEIEFGGNLRVLEISKD